eukprot:18368-Prymnesium_polylepis.1
MTLPSVPHAGVSWGPLGYTGCRLAPGAPRVGVRMWAWGDDRRRAAGQGERDLRKNDVLPHNRLALPRSAASVHG